MESFSELDFKRFDRLGLPEAIYSPGKTPTQIVTLLEEKEKYSLMVQQRSSPILATRADPKTVEAILEHFVHAEVFPALQKFPQALKTVVVSKAEPRPERVCVITGGSTDLVAAGEAEGTLSSCGFGVDIIADVGVAGLHRLLSKLELIKDYDLVIVMAGMEGALASVLGGLIPQPIVAVPTSTGYGASANGTTAMMSMLASCAPGVSVVGIDNGFGAACSVIRMANAISKHADALGSHDK